MHENKSKTFASLSWEMETKYRKSSSMAIYYGAKRNNFYFLDSFCCCSHTCTPSFLCFSSSQIQLLKVWQSKSLNSSPELNLNIYLFVAKTTKTRTSTTTTAKTTTMTAKTTTTTTATTTRTTTITIAIYLHEKYWSRHSHILTKKFIPLYWIQQWNSSEGTTQQVSIIGGCNSTQNESNSCRKMLFVKSITKSKLTTTEFIRIYFLSSGDTVLLYNVRNTKSQLMQCLKQFSV